MVDSQWQTVITANIADSQSEELLASAENSQLTIHHSLCMFVAMTVTGATKHISEQLKTIYEEGEARSIARWVTEYLTESSNGKANSKQSILTEEQKDKLPSIVSRLLTHEPVQYVLNESWFCGLKFYVDQHVLIPRPETEELVEWIISNCKFPVQELKILDIGSGSGCIPIALKRRIRKAEVWSCDISEEAIGVGEKNAAILGTDVNFIQLDFLNKEQWDRLPSFDIIVSNPPYVLEKNKETMQPNVLTYEPAAALFVPNDDPLIFYKAIAEFGKKKLNTNGSIYTEVHEDFGKATTEVFHSAGYTTELKKDMQQKDRMIKSGLIS